MDWKDEASVIVDPPDSWIVLPVLQNFPRRWSQSNWTHWSLYRAPADARSATSTRKLSWCRFPRQKNLWYSSHLVVNTSWWYLHVLVRMNTTFMIQKRDRSYKLTLDSKQPTRVWTTRLYRRTRKSFKAQKWSIHWRILKNNQKTHWQMTKMKIHEILERCRPLIILCWSVYLPIHPFDDPSTLLPVLAFTQTDGCPE